jgi:hypothetical protein
MNRPDREAVYPPARATGSHMVTSVSNIRHRAPGLARTRGHVRDEIRAPPRHVDCDLVAT